MSSSRHCTGFHREFERFFPSVTDANLIFLVGAPGGHFVPEITTVFWDIGGVILTNGWDHDSRMEAAQMFGLDWEEYRERHDLSFPAFDAGKSLRRLCLRSPRNIRKRARYFPMWRGVENTMWRPLTMSRGS